jgi:hypothetical protein
MNIVSPIGPTLAPAAAAPQTPVALPDALKPFVTDLQAIGATLVPTAADAVRLDFASHDDADTAASVIQDAVAGVHLTFSSPTGVGHDTAMFQQRAEQFLGKLPNVQAGGGDGAIMLGVNKADVPLLSKLVRPTLDKTLFSAGGQPMRTVIALWPRDVPGEG